MFAFRCPRLFLLAASIAAEAAALAAAWKVATWIKIRHAVRAVMKIITAVVIAILKVNHLMLIAASDLLILTVRCLWQIEYCPANT